MATWIIKYGYGKPGVKEETFEGEYREAFQYAASQAYGWGFGIERKDITNKEEEN